MVKLQLSIKAELENVTNLVPASEDFEYFFNVKCNRCYETHPKLVSLNRIEEHDLPSSRGSANFVWRCGFCKSESSAKFEPGASLAYAAENSQYAPLLVVECRGLEFVGFDPKGIWRCNGTESGTPFEVDLNKEPEWSDYDEKAALPVGVSQIEGRWDRA